jgi:hypothetical protein
LNFIKRWNVKFNQGNIRDNFKNRKRKNLKISKNNKTNSLQLAEKGEKTNILVEAYGILQDTFGNDQTIEAKHFVPNSEKIMDPISEEK